MYDYARMYRREYQEKVASRKVRQIERLYKSSLPPDMILFLIAAVLFPVQILQILRK